MMSQCGQRIFRSTYAMFKSRGPHRRVANGRSIKREQPVLPDLVVIERGNLHEEIMGMLPVIDRLAECRFALLKELWIGAFCHAGGVKADHGPQRELAAAN